MKIQAVRYKGCNEIFAGCREPECFEDVEWMRDLRKYSKNGCKIEMIEIGVFNFSECTCGKRDTGVSKAKEQLLIFN